MNIFNQSKSKIQDEKSRNTGTLVHKALNNIITRAVEKINGNSKTAIDKFNLSENKNFDYVWKIFHLKIIYLLTKKCYFKKYMIILLLKIVL